MLPLSAATSNRIATYRRNPNLTAQILDPYGWLTNSTCSGARAQRLFAAKTLYRLFFFAFMFLFALVFACLPLLHFSFWLSARFVKILLTLGLEML